VGNVKPAAGWAWDAARGRLLLLLLHDEQRI
jgi:hypothetical protein